MLLTPRPSKVPLGIFWKSKTVTFKECIPLRPVVIEESHDYWFWFARNRFERNSSLVIAGTVLEFPAKFKLKLKFNIIMFCRYVFLMQREKLMRFCFYLHNLSSRQVLETGVFILIARNVNGRIPAEVVNYDRKRSCTLSFWAAQFDTVSRE